AVLAVCGGAADVGHEHSRLAGYVRPEVPGVRGRVERVAGDVGDMGGPRVLGRRGRLDAVEPVRPQVLQAACDPVDVLFYGHHHVAEHGWAARAGDEEQVGEPGGGDAKIGARAAGPVL